MEIFDINSVEQKIGYSFKDKMLLRKAFTHASYAHEHKQEDNEVLEFFGDAILDFIVTEFLYKNCKGDEGSLTKRRAELVARIPLTYAVEDLQLDKYMLMSSGQKKNARLEDKMFSSVYEALVAAIYLDGGMTATRKFVKNTLINKYLKNKKSEFQEQTSAVVKTELQEYVQKYKLGTIKYVSLFKVGPDHKAEFGEAVFINGKKIAEGKGSSRKIAQSRAAQKALKKLILKKGR